MKFILTYSDFLYTIIIYVLVQARLNPLLTVRSIRISQPCPSSTKQQLATQFISATDIDHNGINVYLVRYVTTIHCAASYSYFLL
ncbi:hypothetical protein OCU04_004514 [Sclerotinia nivalis]|uniref:Uncharacterized protein n=1 Tax=Sclerotinia nivalis TaxID=352851 RepID=A0A9X0DNL0_9HELO|nr:hypothetical protein OCU04_004514 [Sclerotinia nivalis]